MAEPSGLDLGRQAERLRALHFGDDLLVLANVWDAGTARAVEAAGFPAVATSSAAVAKSRGFEDHEQMPADVAFGAVASIAAAVSVPVTADMESGYGLDPAEFVERLLAAGAVGCNYEDSDHRRPGQLRDAGEQAERIAGLRAAAQRAGVGIVVNARVDTFLLQAGSVDEQLAEGVRRARLYLDAGADCVYPIVLADDAVIGAFVEEVPGPVNILFTRAAPPLARLRELGVRRVSVGGGLYRSAMEAFAAGLEGLKG
jgi:2-methylisocitrate lyase-like PEP mutase family enzyme